MAWFKVKKEVEVLHRASVDTIRAIKKIEKKLVRVGRKSSFFGVLMTIVGFVLILNLSFIGTVGAYSIKDKTDALKIFANGTYLVIFQNNSEMRPTGGFIGSFATVTFVDYKIKKIDFNANIFKLDNAFTSSTQIAPPAPLAKITQNHWALRDSNFAVDFPTAAQNIQWFYNQETGQKIDGVIGVNASLVQELLKLIGPVRLDKYDTDINANNFFDIMAQKIEKEYFYQADNLVENEPKAILKDLMPVLMTKAFALPKSKLIKLGSDAMSQKLVLLQSNDETIEQSILANNWGGQIQESDSDYLAVNNANITDLTMQKNGGAKTSLKIKESINYNVVQQDDGLVGNLNLTRSHIGSYAWPDGSNVNWTRILVPLGSTLTKAELNGKDVFATVETGQEAGKTTFALWINTDPQTSNVLNLSYKLPIQAQNYHLLVQKQPGNPGDTIQATFGNQVLFSGYLDHDQDLKLVK